MMYKKVLYREEIAGYENHYNRWPKDIAEISMNEYFNRKSLYPSEYVQSKQLTEPRNGVRYNSAYVEFSLFDGDVYGSMAAQTIDGEWKFFRFGSTAKLDSERRRLFANDRS